MQIFKPMGNGCLMVLNVNSITWFTKKKYMVLFVHFTPDLKEEEMPVECHLLAGNDLF